MKFSSNSLENNRMKNETVVSGCKDTRRQVKYCMKRCSLIELAFHLTPLLIRLLSREDERKTAVLLKRMALE